MRRLLLRIVRNGPLVVRRRSTYIATWRRAYEAGYERGRADR